MNTSAQDSKQPATSDPEKRVKLNGLSKYIFDKICSFRQITDADLMKFMLTEFGAYKEQTLKRRKYDTVNILQNADIIVIQKNGGNLLYKMKHDVPNSLKDLENIREVSEAKQQALEAKRDHLKMLRTWRHNSSKLIELNSSRKSEPETAIRLPLVAMTNKFVDFSTDTQQAGERIKMKFPRGSKLFNNMLGHTEFF